MKNENSLDKYSEQTKESFLDRIVDASEVALNYSDPLWGPIAAFFFRTTITPLVKQRMDNWKIEVVKKLKEFEDKYEKLKPKNLQKNEEFISILLEASTVALKTHQEEKLKALRNLVTNSVIITDVKEDIKQLYISLLDSLTTMHIIILKDFYFNRLGYHGNTSNYNLYRKAFIEIHPDIDISYSQFEIIVNDLIAKGLLIKEYESPAFGTTQLTFQITSREVTTDFFRFISDPDF